LQRLRTMHLFAGAGGGILADILLGHQPVCAVEINSYCQQVLAARQEDGSLPFFPIFDDVAKFDGTKWRGLIDIVAGGFPCQDISTAGKGAGIDGDKSGLWAEFKRIIGEVRPRIVFVENSPALTSRGLHRVLGDLVEMGFDSEWGIFSVGALGGNHERERIWIVAHASGNGLQIGEHELGACIQAPTCDIKRSAIRRTSIETNDPNTERWKQSLGRHTSGIRGKWKHLPWNRDWQIKNLPTLDGTEDGFPHRLERLVALGNAQCPRVAATAFTILSGRF